MLIEGDTIEIGNIKETTESFLGVITGNHFYYGLFLTIVMIILIKCIDLVFKPFDKKGHVGLFFFKGCLKVFVVITLGLRVIELVPGLNDFTSQILMSSSLIVVVLGFIFQEGLSNIVHGFILSVFKPFQIGDRVSVMIDGENITGYIREINARHTVIQNVLNSAHVIVPNAKLDTSTIGNNYYDGNTTSSAFLDVDISYESDLEKAIALLERLIETHPAVSKARKDKHITEPVSILVRDLAPSGISLRAIVLTHTVEENFQACSDIRRALVKAITEDPAIDFAYPHVQVVAHSDNPLVRKAEAEVKAMAASEAVSEALIEAIHEASSAE